MLELFRQCQGNEKVRNKHQVILVGTFLNRFLIPTKTVFEQDFIELFQLA